jgi:hypothetical protein
MIAHILEKPSRTFAGVNYNTNKVDRNKGELMLMANFGLLQGLRSPRPQDLVNYLLMLAAQNKGVANTQFHAVISSRAKVYNKQELTQAAVLWLKEMGYGDQPYLIVFHKDTDNHHVHIVSSRIDRNGVQINRDYEKVRAVKNIDKVLGYAFAMQYNFSTKAQFYMILENQGFLGRDYMYVKKLEKKLAAYRPDKLRMAELKILFQQNKGDPNLIELLKTNHQLDLVFHSSEGKKPYGYSVIDHATKQVLKGSEILSLKYLLSYDPEYIVNDSKAANGQHNESTSSSPRYSGEANTTDIKTQPSYIGPIYIANDVDDQQVLGMKRRRQKKARTNTR